MDERLEGERASHSGPEDGSASASDRTRGGEPVRTHILDRTRPELEEWCEASGFPRYHAGQVLKWIHERLASGFGEMTDLPRRLRDRLSAESEIITADVVRRDSATDGTEKILLRLKDRRAVECVLIPEGRRRSACISTQVGCAVGCVFCASGLEGLTRNLTAGEIVEQVIHLKRLLGQGERITNLVFMGMGEPLHNMANLLKSIEILRSRWGAGLGARRITVSTSGPPRRIPRLTEAGIPVHLAISLHAPNDRLRGRLIPGKTSTVAALLEEARGFFEKTGRRVTFEVALIDGLNSDVSIARDLARLLRDFPCLVNLIPMNPVPGIPLKPPRPEAVASFKKALEDRGVEVAIRKRKGNRIAAACGQLRMREAASVGDGGPARKQA